jgi:hypothetical protein
VVFSACADPWQRKNKGLLIAAEARGGNHRAAQVLRFLKATVMPLELPPDLPRTSLEPPSNRWRAGPQPQCQHRGFGPAGPVFISGTTLRFCHLAPVSGLRPHHLERNQALLMTAAKNMQPACFLNAHTVVPHRINHVEAADKYHLVVPMNYSEQ